MPGIISEHLSGTVIDIFITYNDNNDTSYSITGAAISNTSAFKAIPNINSLLFASVTTVVTGTIFGIVPAIKASKLDPIKAIYK